MIQQTCVEVVKILLLLLLPYADLDPQSLSNMQIVSSQLNYKMPDYLLRIMASSMVWCTFKYVGEGRRRQGYHLSMLVKEEEGKDTVWVC
jgi:hypothetical protein